MQSHQMSRSGSSGLLLREAVAFLAIAAASFVLLSLWTARSGDFPGGFYPKSAEILNRGGALGARLAGWLILWTGASVPSLVALLLLLWGSRAFVGRPLQGLWYRLPASGLFLLSVCMLETMIGRAGVFGDGFLQGKLPGGVYGVHLTGFLRPALGGVPSFLLVGAAGCFSLLTLTGKAPAWLEKALAHRREPGAPREPAPPAPVQGAVKLAPGRGPIPKAAHPAPQIQPTTPEVQEVEAEAVASSRSPLLERIEEEDGDQGSQSHPPVITMPAPPKVVVAIPMADPKEAGEFVLPPLSLLEPEEVVEGISDGVLLDQANTIQRTLSSFKVEVRVSEIQRGPAITLYELELAPGTKATKVVSLSDDLAIALKLQGIRIVYPIPGKSTVGVEVPNPSQEVVKLRELIESDTFRKRKVAIPLLIGKNAQGEPLVEDLARMPHLLIAGQTGAGKSVCLNSIILALLFTRTPEEVRMILVDPKQVELMSYENIPHLMTPVVTDMKKTPAVLSWIVSEMNRRYERLAKVGVRHITKYNALGAEELEERLPLEMKKKGLEHPMPYVVVVVDELGDLMITARREVEESIILLAQKSRAVGIHVVLATQRPSADVITGLIKSNLPSRIAFQVASRVDSRTILDRNGAEKLQGSGDLLFLPPGASSPIRCQGTYVSDSEIRRAVSTIRREESLDFEADLQDWESARAADEEVPENDDLFEQAVQVILETGRGSASLLQRRLEIGYTRASRLIDLMEKRGVVGPFKGSKAREILITLEDWESMRPKLSGGQE